MKFFHPLILHFWLYFIDKRLPTYYQVKFVDDRLLDLLRIKWLLNRDELANLLVFMLNYFEQLFYIVLKLVPLNVVALRVQVFCF